MMVARQTVLRAGFAVASSATLACHARVTREDCARMIDKYLEMVVAADPSANGLAETQASAVREMQRSLSKATHRYREARAQCETQVSRAEYDCAMNANIPDEWEACIE
jgi:hypothetical protein